MESALFLNIVIRQCPAVLKLLASENETLLIWGNTLLILNLALYVVDGIRRLHFQRNRLASKGLNENLHTTAKSQDEMKGALFLNIVIRKCAAILELLSGENKTLLIRGDALLILDLGLNVIDRVRRLDFESDRLASKSLDEDLHTATETEDKMESRFLLDIVVAEGATILKLLSSEDQALLVRRDTLLVLDLRLDVVDSVAGLDLKSDGLARQGLDKDLHTTTQAEYQVERRLLLDVIVAESAPVFQLLARENESLLVRRNAFLILDLGLHILDGIRGLDL